MFRTIRRKFWASIRRLPFVRNLNDEMYVKLQYCLYMGRRLDLRCPKDFNEKIQWLKLHYNNPMLSVCTDKFAVRKYVNEKIGEQYLIPLIGVYDSASEIPFEKFPNQFVLKATHASGWNLICKDKNKFNQRKAVKQIDKWLHMDFSRVGREMHYRYVSPRVVCEEYISDCDGCLKDYKMLTFNGECKYIWVDYVTAFGEKRRNFYDTKWMFQQGRGSLYPHGTGGEIIKPDCLDEMIKVARKLAIGFPQCRVDFYVLDNKKPLFGEMTFTSGNGLNEFYPQSFADELGSYIDLDMLK